VIPFRSIVASQMVRAHKIQPELAEYHVSRMDRKELLRRFKKYARSGLMKKLQSPQRVRVKCQNCGEFNATQRYDPMGCPKCGFPVAIIQTLSDAPPSQDCGARKQAS